MKSLASISRRQLLQSSFAAGVWTLSQAQAQAQTPALAAPPPGFSLWLRFEGERLTLLHPLTEMGQGSPSLLTAIAAEELGLPLERIDVQAAPVEPRFRNPFLGAYATYGSAGLRTAYAMLAPACAAARDMLLRAAAARWGVDVAHCEWQAPGIARQGERELPLAALLQDAAALTPPPKPTPKPRAQWQLLAKVQARRDLPAKSNGQERYGIDQPCARVACVRHAPGFGGRLLAVDEAPALAQRGVHKVIALPNAVAVVAGGYWAAHKGLQALQPRWQAGPASDSVALLAQCRVAVRSGQGDVYFRGREPRLNAAKSVQAFKQAKAVLAQEFEFPFLAHAPLEPLNATVQLHADRVEFWLSTQNASSVQDEVAKLLGWQPEQVIVHPMSVGGGFGRRIEIDFVVEALRIAQALGDGQALKLIWSREEDLRSGYYRPAGAVRAQLALDAEGQPQALRADLAGARIDDHSIVKSSSGPDQPDMAGTMGWLDTPYAIPHVDLRHSKVDPGVPVCYWRSVGGSQNVHAYETLIDLAARRLRQDPVAYRRRLLASAEPKHQRALAFVNALAERAGWGRPLAKHHYRGFAFNEANRSLSGHVVEIEALGARRFRIVRITAAIDAGLVLNPDAVEAQLMGGTVFGLTAALFGEISLAKGEVQQSNFHDYRLLSAAELPPLDLLVLANGERPGGVGEEGVPTVAPALGNALLAASGQVLSRLPVARSGWEWVV